MYKVVTYQLNDAGIIYFVCVLLHGFAVVKLTSMSHRLSLVFILNAGYFCINPVSLHMHGI